MTHRFSLFGPGPMTRAYGLFPRPLARAAGVVLLWLVCVGAAEACPTCKDALANSPNGANLVRGYFWSILFMMSMPFLIFGCLGGYFYWEVRRARRAQQQAAGQVPALAGTANAMAEQ